MKSGRSTPDRYDRSSIRMLGTVGEPINPEAWLWYREVIGAGRAPVVDTWWQTETGAIMVSPLPGVTSTKPWPAMLRGIWENPEWFIETYGEKFALPGVTNRRMYFAGDGGRRGSGR